MTIFASARQRLKSCEQTLPRCRVHEIGVVKSSSDAIEAAANMFLVQHFGNGSTLLSLKARFWIERLRRLRVTMCGCRSSISWRPQAACFAVSQA